MNLKAISCAILLAFGMLLPTIGWAQGAVSHRGNHPNEQLDDEYRLSHLEGSAGALIGLILPQRIIDMQVRAGRWEEAEYKMADVVESNGTSASVRLKASGTTVVNYKYRYMKDGREEQGTYPFTIHIHRVSPEMITLPSTLYLGWDVAEQIQKHLKFYPAYSECGVQYEVDDPSVVDVLIDGNPRLIGRHLAETTLHVTTSTGLHTDARIVVQTPEVSSVDLKAGDKTLRPGEMMQLDARLYPERAVAILTWISENPDVVSVNEYGRITAHREGKATIRVTTDNGKKDSVTIKVKK